MTVNQTSQLANIADKISQFGQKSRIRPVSSVKTLCVVGCFAAIQIGYCLDRSEATVRTNVTQWMTGHPVMGTQPRSITKVEVYPNEATPGAVSVVSLSPQGTVVVNRDTRLPLIVMYAPDSTINTADAGEPANHAANMLKTLGANESYVKETSTIQTDVYVPAMLPTSWGQWAPFNLYMPQNPARNNERAVTGCGTIGMAQILNYYQWPPYGEGNLTHTDTRGSFQPTLATNFDHVFRWDLMKQSYTGTETGADAGAVAQLAYDIAVLGRIDCEYNVSSINLDKTGSNLASHMFYAKENVVVGNVESRRTIEQNLLKGIPVPGDIAINQAGSGHAVVFDGLLSHKGETSYHINYGWYGQYNVWWDKNALLDVWQVKPGILPELVPLPTNQSLRVEKGVAMTVPWKIATQRQAEVTHLTLYQQTLKTGTWEDDCESLPATTDTRAWSLSPNGWPGSCWKANSPYASDYLTIVDEFIPTPATTVEFQEKHQCADNYAQIEVSVDGKEFQSIHRFGKSIQLNWVTKTIPLGEFSGKKLKLRVGYYAPPYSAYYGDEQGGGIWIDNMRVNNTLIKSWVSVDTISAAEFQKNGQDVTTIHSKFGNLPIGTYTFSARLTRNNGIESRSGSEFTVDVYDAPVGPANYASWAAANSTSINPNEDSDNDGIANSLEYAVGTADPTGSNGSLSIFSMGNLSFSKRAKAVTNGDVAYRIEVSTDLGVTDSWDEVPSYTVNNSTTIAANLPTVPAKNFARLRVIIAP